MQSRFVLDRPHDPHVLKCVCTCTVVVVQTGWDLAGPARPLRSQRKTHLAVQLTRLTQYRDVCERNGPLTPGLPRRENAIIAPNLNLLTWDLLHHIDTLILAHTLLKTLFDVLPHSLNDFPGNSSQFINNLLAPILFTLWRKCQSWLHSWFSTELFQSYVLNRWVIWIQFERASFFSLHFRGSAERTPSKTYKFFLSPNAVRFIFRKGSYSPPSALFCKLALS